MAGRDSLLPSMASCGVGGCKDPDHRGDRANFPGLGITLLSGKQELQGLGGGLLPFHLSGHSFFWAAHRLVRLPVSRRSVDHSPTLPTERNCPAVAYSATVLPLDKHPRIVVPGSGCLRYHCSGRARERNMGTCGGGAVDATTVAKALDCRAGERGCTFPKSLRISPGAVSLRSRISTEAQHIARGGMGVVRFPRLARQAGTVGPPRLVLEFTIAQPPLDFD